MKTIILRNNTTVHGKHYTAGMILDVDDHTADVIMDICKSGEEYDEAAEKEKQSSVEIHQPSASVASGE